MDCSLKHGLAKLALAAIVGTFALPATAQTYFKCVDASGKINFSDRTCDGKDEITQHQQRTNVIDSSGARESALRQENQALQERVIGLENGQAQRSSNTPAGSTGAQVQDKMECERANRDYQSAASSIKPNRDLIESRRSAMLIACGQPEPAQTVTGRVGGKTICRSSGQTNMGSYSGVTICK